VLAQSKPYRAEFHAGANKRKDLKQIDSDNARLYNQLSKQ
jgi:hypothetical protein